jgi:hypothetical protein
MTRRDEILKVGLEYGWTEEYPITSRERDMLFLIRRPDPDSRSMLRVQVVFKDHAHTTVAECLTGPTLHSRLTGGHQAIKRYLRWHGRKIA